MASILEEESKKVFPKDPMDKKLLLASIKKYKPEGMELGCERVSQLYLTSFGKYQMTAQLTVTEDSIKTLQYELDEEGQFVMVEDELGEEKKKVVVKEGHLATAVIYLNVSCDAEGDVDEETEFKLYPSSGSYPLIKAALQESGDLPEDMKKVAFRTNQKEVSEALEGFDFIGKVGKSNGKFKFEYLDVV